MSYEPGSGECRVLISSKEQIETMLLSLGKLEGTTDILQQLREVHGQLELLHDQRRSSELKAWFTNRYTCVRINSSVVIALQDLVALEPCSTEAYRLKPWESKLN